MAAESPIKEGLDFSILVVPTIISLTGEVVGAYR